MSERKLIQSIINRLEDVKQIVQNSGLDEFSLFVLGFACGIDSDTDRLQEQIAIIKDIQNANYNQQQIHKNNRNDQQILLQKQREEQEQQQQEDATPPLDDHSDNHHHNDDNNNHDQSSNQDTNKTISDQFSIPSNNNSNNKKGGYLQNLQRINHNQNQPNHSEMSNNSSKHNHNHHHHHNDQNNKQMNQVDRQHSDFDMNDYMKQMQDQDEEEKRTLELIRQLQEEDEECEKDRRMKLQDDDDIDCPICMCELYTEGVLALETCDHVFHKECLLEYIKNKIIERKAQIVCPDEKCKIEIAVDDFKQLLGKEMYENYIKYSLESYVDEHGDEMSWCPTPDCKYVFAYDENEDEAFFKCILCKKQYCLKCRVPYHEGMTCKEFEISNKRDENDLKFEKFVKGKKFKQCIKCKFWVEKNEGCDHMTCRCKYEFCYKCGGKYRECECVQKQKEQMERLKERRQARMAQKKAPRAARKTIQPPPVPDKPVRGRRGQK